MPEKKNTHPANSVRNIVSWNWSFGDGGTSTQQNPTHVYTAEGSYTVSLTVSNGTTQNTMTKEAYIRTGIYGVPEAVWEKGVSIYPNPIGDQFNINSEVKINSLKLYDLNGRTWLEQAVDANKLLICLPELGKGYYILQLVTEKGTMQRKLSVN